MAATEIELALMATWVYVVVDRNKSGLPAGWRELSRSAKLF